MTSRAREREVACSTAANPIGFAVKIDDILPHYSGDEGEEAAEEI